MRTEPWLPIGHELSPGLHAGPARHGGSDWQLCDARGGGTVLLAHPALCARWFAAGLVEEGLFGESHFGEAVYRVLHSPPEHMLLPVSGWASPQSHSDALSFACAMRETRRLDTASSLHDAVFLEQYSRLLPTWSLTPRLSDAEVLGTWLSAGVPVSTESFRRLGKLTTWMPPRSLAEVVRAAGLRVTSGMGAVATTPTAEAQPAPVPGGVKEAAPFRLAGRPSLEAFFNEHIVDIIRNEERYAALGIGFPGGVILHGPPGCGKTFAVERLVEYLDLPSVELGVKGVASPYIHETSKKIGEAFDEALDSAPSVMVIDEMEAFLADRQHGGTASLHHVEESSEFLRRIPEALEHKVLVIGMTNLLDMIDPAFLRRGRFDHVVEVGMPAREEVAALLNALLEKLPHRDLRLDALRDALTGRPLSDAAFAVREAARLAARAGHAAIDQESIDAALSNLPDTDRKPERRIGFTRDRRGT